MKASDFNVVAWCLDHQFRNHRTGLENNTVRGLKITKKKKGSERDLGLGRGAHVLVEEVRRAAHHLGVVVLHVVVRHRLQALRDNRLRA